MVTNLRTLSLALASAAATAVLVAAPASASTSVHLYTDPTLAGCQNVGNNGVSGGVFSSYDCVNGVAGHSLNVDAAPGTVAGVLLGTLPQSLCQSAGSNGVTGGVFTSFQCRNGFTGYDLIVTG